MSPYIPQILRRQVCAPQRTRPHCAGNYATPRAYIPSCPSEPHISSSNACHHVKPVAKQRARLQRISQSLPPQEQRLGQVSDMGIGEGTTSAELSNLHVLLAQNSGYGRPDLQSQNVGVRKGISLLGRAPVALGEVGVERRTLLHLAIIANKDSDKIWLLGLNTALFHS